MPPLVRRTGGALLASMLALGGCGDGDPMPADAGRIGPMPPPRDAGDLPPMVEPEDAGRIGPMPPPRDAGDLPPMAEPVDGGMNPIPPMPPPMPPPEG